jgi:prolyl-tRNA synthetase
MVVKAGEGVAEAAAKLADELRVAGVRVEVDDRVDTGFGRRAVDWELKGVPVRVEVGPRDLTAGEVTVVRRIPGTKTPRPIGSVAGFVVDALAADQVALYDEAVARRDANIADVASIDEAVEATASGWARLPWAAVGTEGEAVLAQSGVTVRCLVRADGGVPDSEEEPGILALVGRAY